MHTVWFMPAERHSIWMLWDAHATSRLMPAVMDDFGMVVLINVKRALYSLSLQVGWGDE